MPNIPISMLFPIPTDPDDFEDLCVDIFRVHWKRPGLDLYGTRGQRQNGIDLLDLGGIEPLHAAQCKLREYGKSLSPSDIVTDINDALKFGFPLGKYAIITTAKSSTQTQNKILEINSGLQRNLVELVPWGKLCRLLQLAEYDEIRKKYFEDVVITTDSRIGSKSPVIAQTYNEARTATIAVNLTAEIDEARDAIQRREFEIGLLLLNRIRQRSDFSSASTHDCFRISSNLGAAELGLRRLDAAAEHFLDAFTFEPTDERARANEAYAYLLKGDNQTAHAKATVLRAEYPKSAKVAVNWIVSAPQNAMLVTLEDALPDEVKADPDVAIALSRRALVEMNMDVALSYAEIAAQKLPESSQPALLIALVNMGWIMRANVGLEIPNIGRAELESRVESNLATTIARAEAERDTATQSEALAMRADLRIIQKRFEEAEIDCKEALRADPESVKPLLALSHLMGNSKRVEEAIQLLERAYRKGARPEAAFMYARALLQRNGKEDVDAAVSLLTAIKIDDLRSQFRFSVASAAVEAMLRRASYEEANDYLTVVSASLRPEAVDTLRGYIEFAQGENAAAEHFTAQASSKLSSDTGIEIKESLARLFGGLGKFADSLPLLQEIFDLNTQDFEWGRLLDCAARLRRDDVVMKTCAELRRRGQDAWEMVSFEAQYLQKYSRDKAVALLDDFLKSHPGHKLALLSRSVIGVQSRQLALVSGSIDQLPTVEDLPLEYIVAAVHILRFVGAGNDAVDYAYRYLRLHFDDIRAHEALILSLVAGGPSITIPPTQDFAEVGSAVCVFEDSANAVRWFVVEHTDKPNADFEEISSESVLAKELIGKRVGDSVVLAKGQMQSRTGIVRQVIPKYVRRYQDVMAEMQVRFGDKSSIESMHIGTTEEETAKAIEKILDSVKNREAAIAQLRVLYDQMPVSLHMFGARFGENAYVALASLAQEDGQFVKVTFGTPEERTQATFALQAAANVVVDITAVATLRLIGLEILLKSRRFHFQMSEGTFGELQETLVGDLFSSSTSATINHRAGVPAVVEDTADQKAERRARDDEFLKSLKAAVEIVPVLELSDVEPSKREPLEKAFGQYGAESIILAAKSDSILWTDDLIQAEMAKNEFGAKRAWTELIVEQSVMADGLTIEERQQAVAALIGMEYSVTSFDSSTVLKAIEMSDAKSWRTPLKQFVNVFRKPHTNSQGMLGIFVDFTTKLYRESYLPETKCEVTTTFLDAMWENAPLRLTLLLLRKATPQLFGLNPVGQKQFETCFDKWYLDKPDKLIGT